MAAWRSRSRSRSVDTSITRTLPSELGRQGRRQLRHRHLPVRHGESGAHRGEVGAVRGAEDAFVGAVVLGSAESTFALLEQREDAAAVVVGDDDREVARRRRPVLISSPVASCTKVRSPMNATVRRSSALSAAPIAVETVPSIMATPRFDSTRTSGDTRSANATSRMPDAPMTSCSPGCIECTHDPRHVQTGDRRPVEFGVDGADRALARASAQSFSHCSDGVPDTTARVPVASTLPGDVGQRGPVVSAYTRTAWSASSRDTPRCSVGRPAWKDRPRSDGIESQRERVQRGLGAGAVGSATVGMLGELGAYATAPCPDTTTVGSVRSISIGTSR